MPDSISRRQFLKESAPVAILGSGVLLSEAPAFARPAKKKRRAKKKRYYVLKPEWNRSRSCNVNERKKARGCHGCKACHAHGKNKMFATRRAADRRRAHKGCKCTVAVGGELKVETWSKLFGGLRSPKRLSVDKRSRRTKMILRRARRRAKLKAKSRG